MKILFAVSSEEISDKIIKRYQKDYKEILAFKNVYYFNAILKEIQKDKTYDRIVISEDLEPFANNNYDTIDKFVFEKLDSISDEAHDMNGNEIPLVLICTERRQKGSNFLVKLFGLGIYNALLGQDRSMEQVCRLISRPRGKKEAKMYYKIDSDEVSYRAESENEVSELEIQNILTHFKKLGKSTERYTESFNNIAAQYTDEQLKIIVNCLPIKVRAVLEEQSQKYKELMLVNNMRSVGQQIPQDQMLKNAGLSINMIGDQSQKINGPIVIPNAVRTSKINKPINMRPIPTSQQMPPQQPMQPAQNVPNAQAVPQQPVQQIPNTQIPNSHVQTASGMQRRYTPEQIRAISYRQAEIQIQKANLQSKYTPEQIKVITQRQAAVIAQKLQAMQAGVQPGPSTQGAVQPAQQNTQGTVQPVQQNTQGTVQPVQPNAQGTAQAAPVQNNQGGQANDGGQSEQRTNPTTSEQPQGTAEETNQ